MNDAARVKILKAILGMMIVSAATNLIMIKNQERTIQKLCKKIDRQHDRLVEANKYVRKIVEVTKPSDEQIAQINEEFDVDLWSAELNFDVDT